MLTYNGTQIGLYSDERHEFVNLTDMAKAWRGRKSIRSWMRNSATIAFLTVWEKKHNPKFNGVQMDTVGFADVIFSFPSSTLNITLSVQRPLA